MKLAIGAVLTFFAVALAGQRAERITRLIATGQPAPDRFEGAWAPPAGRAGRGLRPAQAAQAADPRAGPLLHLLGLRDPADHHRRGLRGAVQRDLRPAPGRAQPAARLPPGPDRGRGPGQPGRLRGHPRARVAGPPGPGLALLRLPHRPGLGHPRHDRPGDRHPAAVPGGQGGQGHLPLRRLGVRLHGRRAGPGRPRPLDPAAAQRGLPARPPGGRARVPGAGHVLQAPAHLHRPVQRRLLPPPQGPRARWPPPASTPRR